MALIPRGVLSADPFSGGGLDFSDLPDMPHLGPLGPLLIVQKAVSNGKALKKLFCDLQLART